MDLCLFWRYMIFTCDVPQQAIILDKVSVKNLLPHKAFDHISEPEQFFPQKIFH